MTTRMEELDQIVDEVVELLYDQIIAGAEALAPDGVGFSQEKKPMEQQLAEYRILRNDVTAWKIWTENKALEIGNEMRVGGASQEAITAINPIILATAAMIKYSSDMEKELSKRMA